MKKVKSFIAVLMALIISMSFASMAFAADVSEADATNGVASGADAFAIGDTVTGKIPIKPVFDKLFLFSTGSRAHILPAFEPVGENRA